MRAPLRWLYGRLGRRYPRAGLLAIFQIAHVVVLVGVGLLWLYVEPSGEELVRILVVAQALLLVENALGLMTAFRLVRPADPWLRGERTPATAVAAWTALTGLPRDFMRTRGASVWLVSVLPVSVYVVWELGYPFFPSIFAFTAASAIVLVYGVFARYFAVELMLRPVLEDISADLPDRAELGKGTVGLRARLLFAIPVINIITGVVVAAFASGHEGFEALVFGILAATAVAVTVSLEMSLLLARSLFDPLVDLQRATERVAEGDFDVRVPVVGTDETGRLSQSFNQMVVGLKEREALHEAFGAFVDPLVAERVLEEGTVLEGEEVDVSVLFLDIRGFTAFAERASATAVVQRLNEFYERVVPLLEEHGGHANKFIGDGLLAVFGAPERRADHADRAVAAALAIAAMVRAQYGDELRIGVGVNSGTVVAGTIGGGGRVEFTVIGDVVNTAARVESATRETGDDVLVTEATRARLRRDYGEFEERGAVELKGKTEKVRLLAPRAAAPALPALGEADAPRGVSP